jgi:hypothetical protein
VAKNLNPLDFEIEGTFSFGVFGNIIPCMRNANHNDVGGYMKGRSVIVGETSRTKYPALPTPE